MTKLGKDLLEGLNDAIAYIKGDKSRVAVYTPKQSVTGFMDGIDFECELGHAKDGNKVYPSIEALEKGVDHSLVECGIVEVEVRFVRWIRKPDYSEL